MSAAEQLGISAAAALLDPALVDSLCEPTSASELMLEAILASIDDPARAADLFDALADRMHKTANDLRLLAATAPTLLPMSGSGASADSGSVGDRVKIRVHGPDGAVKQEVDTGSDKME